MPKMSQNKYRQYAELPEYSRIRAQGRVPRKEFDHVRQWLLRPTDLSRRAWIESLLVGLWCSGATPTTYVTDLPLAERGLELEKAMDLARLKEPATLQPLHSSGKRRPMIEESIYLDVEWLKGVYMMVAHGLEKSGLRTPSRLISAVWAWSQAESQMLPRVLAAQLAATCEYWSKVYTGQPNIPRTWEVIARAGDASGYKCTPHSLLSPECTQLESSAMPWTAMDPIGYER